MGDALYCVTKLCEQGKYYGDLRTAIEEDIMKEGGFDWVSTTGVSQAVMTEHMDIVTRCIPKWESLGKPAREAVMTALNMLTGCWALPTVTHVRHLDAQGMPCCGSKAEARKKTVEAFLGLLFHCMVGTPCEVRWMSFVNAVGFWGVGVLIHNVISRAWCTAFPKIAERFRARQKREAQRADRRGQAARGRGQVARAVGGRGRGLGRARGRGRGPRALGGRGRGDSLCFTTSLGAVDVYNT